MYKKLGRYLGHDGKSYCAPVVQVVVYIQAVHIRCSQSKIHVELPRVRKKGMQRQERKTRYAHWACDKMRQWYLSLCHPGCWLQDRHQDEQSLQLVPTVSVSTTSNEEPGQSHSPQTTLAVPPYLQSFVLPPLPEETATHVLCELTHILCPPCKNGKGYWDPQLTVQTRAHIEQMLMLMQVFTEPGGHAEEGGCLHQR